MLGAGTACPTQWCYSVSNTSVFFKTSIDIKNQKKKKIIGKDMVTCVLFFVLFFRLYLLVLGSIRHAQIWSQDCLWTLQSRMLKSHCLVW